MPASVLTPLPTPASEAALDFPGLLRYWRGRRGYSQLALSLAAGVSQRHISFLESGRARPSRAMVLALADRLAVPLRQRNRMLLAGGFAPAYTEHALAAPPLQRVRQAIALILAKQEPYPAVVLDRYWHVVDANLAYRCLLGRLHGLEGPLALPQGDARINLMLAVFDPQGLWPALENAQQVGRYLLRRFWQEMQQQAPDESAQDLLAQVAAWHPQLFGPDGTPGEGPGEGRGEGPDGDGEGGEGGEGEGEREALAPVLPVTLRVGTRRVAMFSTLTTLGSPRDITLQEVHIESFFPADDATREIFEQMAREQMAREATAAGEGREAARA